MSDGSVAGVLVEIEHSLGEILAAHAHPASLPCLKALSRAASSWELKDFDAAVQGESRFHQDLMQLQWMCSFAGSRALGAVAQLVLTWLEEVDHRSITPASALTAAQPEATTISMFGKRFASWLAARMLAAVLSSDQLPIASAETDALASMVLNRSFQVFEAERQSELKRAQHGPGGFFSAFMSSVPALKHSSSLSPTMPDAVDDVESGVCVQQHALELWRLVLGRAAQLSPRVTREILQRELSKPELVANVSKASIAQMSYIPPGSAVPHPYLQFLSELSLGFVSGGRNPSQGLKDAALLLKLFFPLLGKPFKSRVRRGAAALLSNILRRERVAMDRDQFKSLLWCAPVGEWNSCVSEMHALALKLSHKRKALAAGWELRVSVLALAPSDIFGRYWKDDMHALLRLQYKYSKYGGGIGIGSVTGGSGDAIEGSPDESIGEAILRCVRVSFTNFVQRYLLAEGPEGSPSESDGMEIINTAQAWCFFSSHRHKSVARFLNTVIPALVDLSVAIAAFNMRYVIQSHLRRLLTEADDVVDDKKLVGLKVFLALCRHCSVLGPSQSSSEAKESLAFDLDAQTFLGQLKTLGEIAGHMLILCNSLLGHDMLFDQLSSMASTLLPASSTVDQAQAFNTSTRLLRDENKRLLAIEIFATALRTLEFVYNEIELRSDQKVLLLVRASVHRDEAIRASATETLLAIAASDKLAVAGSIIRGLTDYLVRMASNNSQANDAEPLTLLLRLCSSLIQAASNASCRQGGTSRCWEDDSTVWESFLQVEAASVFLLAHTEAVVRLAAIEALKTVHELRTTVIAYSDSHISGDSEVVGAVSAVDVIKALEPMLKERFFTFKPSVMCGEVHQADESRDGNEIWYFRRLADDWGDTRHSFRWSMCLATVFPALASNLPQLMIYFWSDANDKVSKLEPVIATFNDSHIHRYSSVSGDISRWRNLSIFATASAYRTLELVNCSIPASLNALANSSSSTRLAARSAISSVAIAALLKRLGRYLKSASMEQQKAAIVALSATHRSSHVLLIDMLSKCESDAFSGPELNQPSTGKASRTDSFETLVRSMVYQPTQAVDATGSSSRRHSKSAVQAKSNRQTSQLQAQWALSRCHRLLLEGSFANAIATISAEGGDSDDSVSGGIGDELLLSAASSFLVRMANAIDGYSAITMSNEKGTAALLAGVGGHMIFMIQQDFCGAVQLLLKHLTMLDRKALSETSNNCDSRTKDADERLSQHEMAKKELGTVDSFVTEARAAQWVKSLLGWCISFGSLTDPTVSQHLDSNFFAESSPLYRAWTSSCDVFGIREQESGQTLPWLWLDEPLSACFKSLMNQDPTSRCHGHHSALAVASSTRFLRFFTCGHAFSTLATLIVCSRHQFFTPNLKASNSPILSWLDECFAVDATRSAAHFLPLQQLCQAAAQQFLDADRDGFFRSICIEKACFRRSSGAGHAVAKQYMLAMTSQARRFSVELMDASNAMPVCGTTWQTGEHAGSPSSQDIVDFVYALLLHLGATADPSELSANDIHRAKVLRFVKAVLPSNNSESEQAARWLGSVTVSTPLGSMVLATEVRSRIQVAAASSLASSFPELRFAVCVAMFRFLHRCDIIIQRSMLGAALPLLVDTDTNEVSDQSNQPGSELMNGEGAGSARIGTLLELMFKLTMSISDACAEQLDRVWLTLAYSSASNSTGSSLLVIVAFLAKKSKSPAEMATAKLILWWLARWQDAAYNVISALLNYVEARRLLRPPISHETRESAQKVSVTVSVLSDSKSLDEIAILVSLASDASCHLQQSSAKAFKEVVLQAIHFALLLHFATASTSPSINTTTSSTAHNSACNKALPLDRPDREPQHEEAAATATQLDADTSVSIRRNCVVLLQSLTPFLNSVASPDAVANAMNEVTTCIDGQSAHTCQPCFAVESPSYLRQVNSELVTCSESERYLHSLESLAQSITAEDAALWSELCVKEIALALSSVTSSPPAAKLTTSATIQARFAVILYGFLAPEFNGDVFLAILELLHVALDEHLHDAAAYEPLICDCLVQSARMVERMPESKLALYPQVLWVCTALLNHFASPVAREATLVLLRALLFKPMLVTSEVLADIIFCKKPAQWSTEQSSVLRALVSNLHIKSRRARIMTIEMVVHCTLLLPHMLLVVAEAERVIICSLGLLPVIAVGVSRPSSRIVSDQVLADACNDLAAQWEAIVGQMGPTEGATSPCEAVTAMLDLAAFFHDRAQDLSKGGAIAGASPREAIASFARTFLTAVAAAKRSDCLPVDGLSLAFDILTQTLSGIDANSLIDSLNDSTDSEIMSELDASAFIVAEELLIAMETTDVQWRPPPALVSTLTRMSRQPERRTTWKSAVRLLTYASTKKAPSRLRFGTTPTYTVGSPATPTPQAAKR